MSKYQIRNTPLKIDEIEKVIINSTEIGLSQECKKAISKCRNYLDSKLKASDKAFYGINTGFGSLCNIKISDGKLEHLQENLLLSHACGVGNEIPQEIVRLMLFLKVKSLSFGFSGVRLITVEKLISMYNHKMYPEVFELGSLGASGDLAPLAHLTLPLIGEGKVNYKNKKISSKKAFSIVKEEPLRLAAKEGLALLNGTQFSLSFALWSVIEARKLLKVSSFIAAMSIDGFLCTEDPFNDKIHRIRKQKGQRIIAKEIRQILKGSQLQKKEKETVQDPYSFRCVPQVHGASYDAIDYVSQIVEREFNSVTDNPNIFPDEDKILTGGNFHAQAIALSLDFLAIALSELGSISERRTYQLICGERGLPDFLTTTPGLNSGFMIAQYTAASVVSQNKQLCTPASVDSIVSSKGQEDHVSMAANAGTKMYRIVNNLWSLMSIEFMVAAQALHLRKPTKSSPKIEKQLSAYRKIVKPLTEDRYLRKDIIKTEDFIRNKFKS